MTITARYANAARSDLIELWLHIAQDDIAAADRQVDRIEQAIVRLLDFPDIGHERSDAGRGVRVLLQDSYLVIYRHLVSERLVIIERVVHGRRNLVDLME